MVRILLEKLTLPEIGPKEKKARLPFPVPLIDWTLQCRVEPEKADLPNARHKRSKEFGVTERSRIVALSSCSFGGFLPFPSFLPFSITQIFHHELLRSTVQCLGSLVCATCPCRPRGETPGFTRTRPFDRCDSSRFFPSTLALSQK